MEEKLWCHIADTGYGVFILWASSRLALRHRKYTLLHLTVVTMRRQIDTLDSIE